MNTPGSELGRADRRHLDAAEGWLGLGTWSEALQELEQISPAMQTHPQVLWVRCVVFCEARNWDECVKVAARLVELMPQTDFPWINRAYALRRTADGGLQAAYDALLPAADKVDDVQTVAFNLACYTCQMGRIDEARAWLKRSFAAARARGQFKQLKQQALEEPDLAPLHKEIAEPQSGPDL